MLRPSASRIASRHLQAKPVGRGDTIETPNGLRVHRLSDYIQVWDLENAGKRGKKVDRFSVGNHRGGPAIQQALDELSDFYSRARNYRFALTGTMSTVEILLENDGLRLDLDQHQERGIDVTPAGFAPVKVNGQYVYIDAGYKSFTVRDKVDQNNMPTCIPAIRGGKADIKVFYRWVKDNQSALRSMKFYEVLRGMSDEGIKYHQYCAMD